MFGWKFLLVSHLPSPQTHTTKEKISNMIDFSGKGGKDGAVIKCGNCQGSGMQIRIQQLAPGMVQQIQTVCGECRGQGEVIDPKLRCKNCMGKKIVKERKILEVHIDKGNFERYFLYQLFLTSYLNDNLGILSWS